MRFGHIELFVRDPLHAKPFYTDVMGFNLVAVQDDRFVWVEKGGTEILLRPAIRSDPAASYQEAGSALVLYTDDLEAEMAGLVSRGLTFRGCDGGESCPTFTDPDGNWFMLVDPRNH